MYQNPKTVRVTLEASTLRKARAIGRKRRLSVSQVIGGLIEVAATYPTDKMRG